MFDFAWIGSADGWAALVTLTAMEVVLGIDNVVFLSVLIAKLPEGQGRRVRIIGLAFAFLFRVAFLFALTSLMQLTATVVSVLDRALSWRDLILIGGGLFLIYKATLELHHAIEGHDSAAPKPVTTAFSLAVAQVVAIDLVFSIDSILTAIGMAKVLSIMVAAVVIAMAVMFFAAGAVAGFIRRHRTAKVLALAFLLLIGISLVAEGWHFDIPRGYIYSAMAFAAVVEALNLLGNRRRAP